MDDNNNNSTEPKGKEPDTVEGETYSGIESGEDRVRRPSEGGHILFAPDPRETLRRERTEDITPLSLTRTFSRQSRFSSYSTATDEETARIRRVTSRRTIEPQTRLPTGRSSIGCILRMQLTEL